MPRLQCNQGQQKGTSPLRSLQKSDSKNASEPLHMEQTDWIEEVRSSMRRWVRSYTEMNRGRREAAELQQHQHHLNLREALVELDPIPIRDCLWRLQQSAVVDGNM